MVEGIDEGSGSSQWRELIRKRLADPSAAEAEEAVFLSLAESKRRSVVDRLKVFDDYLELQEPTAAKADEAAAKLGLGRRSFYQLLAKMREHGPVRGLAPGYRLKQRPSVAKDGLGEVAEAALSKILKAEPEATVGNVYRTVAAACTKFGLIPPREFDVRRRLHEVRRIIATQALANVEIGSSLLIDQSPIDMALLFLGRREQAVLTLVVDRASRLIIGVGVSVADDVGLGLESAISWAERQLPEFAKQGIPVAQKIEQIEFVVPPFLEGLGAEWKAKAGAGKGLPSLKVVENGPKRHGFALVRLIGDKVGMYSLRVRSPMTTEHVAEDVISHHPHTALKVMEYAVSAWNRPIIEKLQGRQPVGEAEQAATELGRCLKSLFEPFFSLARERAKSGR